MQGLYAVEFLFIFFPGIGGDGPVKKLRGTWGLEVSPILCADKCHATTSPEMIQFQRKNKEIQTDRTKEEKRNIEIERNSRIYSKLDSKSNTIICI